MLAYLRLLLAALLALGIIKGEADSNAEGDGDEGDGDEGAAGTEAEGEEGAAGEGDDEDDLAALGEHADEATERERTAATARRKEIEEVAEATARRVQGARPAPAAPNYEAQLREREDAELAEMRGKGATEAQIENRRWEIDANRALRESNNKSNMALFRAEELNDKSEFRELASDPVQGPIYRAYKDKVEAELSDLRAKGVNVNRTTLMYYMYGRDRALGKVKLKTKAAPKKEGLEALPSNVRRIDRGRAPGVGARGDVDARGGKLTNKQALEKRLAGKII